MTTLDALVREQVVALLEGGHAHMSFEDAVANFPASKIDHRPPNVDYTFWHLVEHVRIAQHDMLLYLTDAHYEALAWPQDYWPALDATTDKAGWDASIAAFMNDRDQLIAMTKDPAVDLTATVPSNSEHTILRCVLVIADHNAYHIGELGILRQVDDAWGT